jgi:hypothetical protein
MLAAALLAAVAVALPVDERTLTANLLQLLYFISLSATGVLVLVAFVLLQWWRPLP